MKLKVIHPDWPLQEKVSALTTTRLGGVSQRPYNEFNLALHVGDKRENVLANRSLLYEQFSLKREPCWLQQTHSNRVVDASFVKADNEQADASYTTSLNTICAVLTADCLPILLSDEEGSCIGVVHVGWRGLLAGVIQRTVAAMAASAKPTFAWLGPAIGPRKFEVGSDVHRPFVEQNVTFEDAFIPNIAGKWNLDIYRAAKVVLAAADIINVYGGNYCTFTDREQFFSYRRSSRTGRMATLIWRK